MSLGRSAAWALLLITLGWTVGYANRPEPDFVLAIDAPVGETHVECVSGCRLIGARDLGNPKAGLMRVYSYSCSGTDVRRCGARVAGWKAVGTGRHDR